MSMRERLAEVLWERGRLPGLTSAWSDIVPGSALHRTTLEDVDAILREQIDQLRWRDSSKPHYDLKAAIRVLNRILNESCDIKDDAA